MATQGSPTQAFAIRLLKICAAVWTVGCAAATPVAEQHGTDLATLSRIEDQLRDQAINASPDANVEIHWSQAAKATLADCAAPSVDTQGQRPLGHLALRVECGDGRTRRVPVEVRALVNAVTYAHSLPSGHRVTAADLVLKPVVSGRGDYVQEPALLIGHELGRSVRAGQLAAFRQTRLPVLIKRGQTRPLHTRVGRVQVSVSAEALADGRAGDNIAVRNLSNQQVLRVWVTASGEFSTRAAPTGEVADAG